MRRFTDDLTSSSLGSPGHDFCLILSRFFAMLGGRNGFLGRGKLGSLEGWAIGVLYWSGKDGFGIDFFTQKLGAGQTRNLPPSFRQKGDLKILHSATKVFDATLNIRSPKKIWTRIRSLQRRQTVLEMKLKVGLKPRGHQSEFLGQGLELLVYLRFLLLLNMISVLLHSLSAPISSSPTQIPMVFNLDSHSHSTPQPQDVEIGKFLWVFQLHGQVNVRPLELRVQGSSHDEQLACRGWQ